MPAAGVGGRGEVLGLLAALMHDRLASPELGGVLAQVADDAPAPGSAEAANLRELTRLHRRATKVPRALVEELARVTATARPRWVEARKTSDFGIFAPDLERTIELKREEAAAVGFSGHPYDALMDEFEPGASTAEVSTLFEDLRGRLVPLVQAIADAPVKPDVSLVRRSFPRAGQERMVRMLGEELGFDFDAGRIDVSTHPFCVGVHPKDVRITTRYDEQFLPGALFGAVHETGHALYEQGLDPDHAFTPAGWAVSCAIHESQSRLWENMVARSRPFWDRHYPNLVELFPDALTGVSLDAFHRAINAVRPSPIRVEADEITYNLHIVVRFELERDLIDGSLPVADLPAAWNEKMHTLVGIEPKDDAEGCLQDIHWSVGACGYFPTYALGNLYAAQIFASARQALPDLDGMIRNGELSPLRDWLRDQIHRLGMRYEAGELCERVTGRPLSVEPFMDYVNERFRPLYGLA